MTKNDFSWFTESRFGMFIHWGTYAVPGRHEWVRHHEMTPRDAYRAYADRFTADRFCLGDWARAIASKVLHRREFPQTDWPWHRRFF
jgi:hypothetical protein